jgi:hypothetical protein
MLKGILRFRTALMFLLGLSLFCPGVFAQGRSSGQRAGHGNRHYYHNGTWNRNGWFGWGAPAPVFSNGVLVASLPPGYTTVLVGGNTYFYGNDMYFRQIPAGGFAVVTIPFAN